MAVNETEQLSSNLQEDGKILKNFEQIELKT